MRFNPKNKNELQKRFKNYDPNVNFTVISNQLARDDRLSWKARGVYAYLASNSHSWVFYESEINTHSKRDGRDSTRSAIRELENAGYLVKHQPRKGGKFRRAKWSLYYLPKGYSKSNSTVDGLSVNGKTVSGKSVDDKSDTNKKQGKQLTTITTNNRSDLRPYSHKKQESRTPRESTNKPTNIKTMITNVYKEMFYRDFTLTSKTKIYLNNWINQIKYHAKNNHDIDKGVEHLKYAMNYTRSKIHSSNPNAIAEYTNSCFMNPATAKSTGIDYSTFIDFGKNRRANLDEILVIMHEILDANIASFMDQRHVSKLIQTYGASQVNKAVYYVNRHGAKIRIKNPDSNIGDEVMNNPVKYMKMTLNGEAW